MVWFWYSLIIPCPFVTFDYISFVYILLNYSLSLYCLVAAFHYIFSVVRAMIVLCGSMKLFLMCCTIYARYMPSSLCQEWFNQSRLACCIIRSCCCLPTFWFYRMYFITPPGFCSFLERWCIVRSLSPDLRFVTIPFCCALSSIQVRDMHLLFRFWHSLIRRCIIKLWVMCIVVTTHTRCI